MEWLLYIVARGLIGLVQAMPLRLVARFGRGCGALVLWFDARHRRVARRNLTRCFPDKSRIEIGDLVRENFRRIGESFACAVKTASMSNDELRPHLEFAKLPAELEVPDGQAPPSVVGAIGHFGNFELYARITQIAPGYTVATTYRGLPQESLNRLLQKMREKSGCQFFERRFDGAGLKAAMNKPGTMLGLLADQDGGDRGLHIPFLGHDCSTSPAPAVFALRYNCPLYTAICYRVGLARWQVEIGQEIPTQEDGKPRSTEAIMRDVNRAFEKAVRRDPANWFWVHNRWKRGRPDATAASEKSTASAVMQDRHK